MVNVAVLGFGVVGSGTVEVLEKNSDRITRNAGREIRIKYILDVREFPDSPFAGLFVKDFSIIENDPDIGVVVETIGGTGAALEFTKRSLVAGKSVVTSNKELVAMHGYELLELAAEKGVNYLFEASVGGGIPIIRPLAQCMAANKINEIYGILNGTTNYILSEMEKNGVGFSDALQDAQKKGYAEADPTADIKGYDACRKVCILSSLAFGRHVYPEQVPSEGIESITINDMRFASNLGYKIKLLGRVRSIGDKISAYVAPHLVSRDNLLAGVEGVMNGVVIRGNAVGDVMFYGAGAGKMPTASAIVADVIDASKHMHSRKLIGWTKGSSDAAADPMQLETAWYVRTDAAREKVKREFGEVVFADGSDTAETAFKTVVMNGKIVREQLDRGIQALSLFRILGDH
ncbi:MAG: homoserine dehydrogenase [Oscillospiraceae bacterium]|nr:homoserine dehydrogenase [Oscillospiraceae bacterium]